MIPAEIIKKKRSGQSLTAEEISFFIRGYTQNTIPDYQMSALLMAIYFKGMTESETLALTQEMLRSGIVVDTSSLKGFKVDKHSTGGVGDKTSLILGPIVAACGIYVPMISGRGLGHTGGTLDKLESIPGFNTQQNLENFIQIINAAGTCFIGQTQEICPADKKIYALRDVTATVESLPLICASIMSKKLAEGIDGLVLDVKFGSGAFMKTLEDCEKLAQGLKKIGEGAGKKVVALLTSMQQPLGRFAGNSLEVFECVEVLKGKKFFGPDGYDLYEDTRELSLQLSAYMIYLSGKTKDISDAYNIANSALVSGRAYEIFDKMCALQGGQLSQLPTPQKALPVLSTKTGFIEAFNVEQIGYAAIQLKAGRLSKEDQISPTAGIEFHKKLGDPVAIGDPVFTIHGDDISLFSAAAERLSACYEISLQKPASHVLIKKILN